MQISELLTNYGSIPLIIFDGWSWQMGHHAIPYDEIHDHVKTLQLDCLMIGLTHLQNLWDVDVAFYEEPK